MFGLLLTTENSSNVDDDSLINENYNDYILSQQFIQFRKQNKYINWKKTLKTTPMKVIIRQMLKKYPKIHEPWLK